jgi:pSer/pThr/pTyr-binding forkhead associated (FHA) protein
MGAAPILTISKNGETLKSQPLEGEVILGRSPGCVIHLDDRAISRQHAIFRPVPGGVQVEKKSDFAPISVNGAECTRAFVKEGDVVSIGPYLLKLSMTERAPTLAPAPDSASVPDSFPPLSEVPTMEPLSGPEAPLLKTENPPPLPEVVEPQEALAIPDLVKPEPEPVFSEPVFSMAAPSAEESFPVDMGSVAIDEEGKTKLVSSAKVSAKLVFGAGAANVAEYEIAKDEVSIGRGKDCDIVLDDKKASRKHAIVRRSGVNFTIKDLDSANGIYVNGVKVAEAEGQALSGDDILKIGNTEFRFLVLSSDYAEKQNQFLPVPEELPEEASASEPPAQFDSQPAHANEGIAGMGAHVAGVGTGGISGIAGIAGIGAKKQTLIEKYKALPPKRKIIWTVIVLTAVYFAFFDEPPASAPKPKTAVVAKDAKGPATFESLTPEQKKFVEAQHALAFDYYKNKDYDKAIFEIEKIFTLIPDYKDSREIERYAKEGKHKLEAMEEEKRKKEEEAKLKVRIAELVESTKTMMSEKRYDAAIEMFSQILALDPDNAQVAEWRKEVERYEEEKRIAEQQKAVQAQINARAWDLYKEGMGLKKEKKYRDAIDTFRKVAEIGATDKKAERQAAARIRDIQKIISDLRDPVLAEAKQSEDSQDYPKAYHLYEQATEIDPSYPAGYAGMDRIRGILHEKAKALYIEAVLAESYTDFETAKKKYLDCKTVAPKDDIYYERAERKLAGFFKPGEEPAQ